MLFYLRTFCFSVVGFYMALSFSLYDAVNAAWEVCATLVNVTNIFSLLKHKDVKGVNVWGSTYFICWGSYNLIWYWHLDQAISWYAAFGMLVTNTIWFCLALVYKYKKV